MIENNHLRIVEPFPVVPPDKNIPDRYADLVEYNLRIIFVYNDEDMCRDMCWMFSRMGLTCFASMDIGQAKTMCRKHKIEMIVIDVVHFDARHIMDFRNMAEDLWITAINRNVVDVHYTRAMEFGATWVPSPSHFMQLMPIVMRAANRHCGFMKTVYGSADADRTLYDDDPADSETGKGQR